MLGNAIGRKWYHLQDAEINVFQYSGSLTAIGLNVSSLATESIATVRRKLIKFPNQKCLQEIPVNHSQCKACKVDLPNYIKEIVSKLGTGAPGLCLDCMKRGTKTCGTDSNACRRSV